MQPVPSDIFLTYFSEKNWIIRKKKRILAADDSNLMFKFRDAMLPL